MRDHVKTYTPARQQETVRQTRIVGPHPTQRIHKSAIASGRNSGGSLLALAWQTAETTRETSCSHSGFHERMAPTVRRGRFDFPEDADRTYLLLGPSQRSSPHLAVQWCCLVFAPRFLEEATRLGIVQHILGLLSGNLWSQVRLSHGFAARLDETMVSGKKRSSDGMPALPGAEGTNTCSSWAAGCS